MEKISLKMNSKISLGINIDHVATLRNARGENDPSLLEMMFEVIEGGAQSITIHLREDRRHIRDSDLKDILLHSKVPVNLEMAFTDEMIDIAIQHRPHSICIVPEKREEITTEGGLNIFSLKKEFPEKIKILKEQDIRVFLFVEPDLKVVETSANLNIDGLEIHTGAFAKAFHHGDESSMQFSRIEQSARLCQSLNLEFHAGHGLNRYNIMKFTSIENLTEVNIGHSIIARALKCGLKNAVLEIKEILRK